jgi:hypothetical protein
MKKLLSLFLLVFFSLSAIGVQVSVHHCMGKTSFTIFGIDFNKDCNCKHQDKSHQSRCCNNHTFNIKALQDSYESSYKIISFKPVSLDKLFVKAQNLFCPLSLSINLRSAFTHPVIDINTLFCVFRI